MAAASSPSRTISRANCLLLFFFKPKLMYTVGRAAEFTSTLSSRDPACPGVGIVQPWKEWNLPRENARDLQPPTQRSLRTPLIFTIDESLCKEHLLEVCCKAKSMATGEGGDVLCPFESLMLRVNRRLLLQKPRPSSSTFFAVTPPTEDDKHSPLFSFC